MSPWPTAAVAYDALVVATGVRPRVLPGRRDGVHVLRTVADALTLRERLAPGRRLVIVGAGLVGTEVAATARARGCEVTMLESATAPIVHEIGEAAGRFLAGLHREHGVELRTGAAVAEITEDGVRLEDGTEVEGDDVLLAVGSEPNTEWLTAEDLKIHNGLVCDEYCAAAPDVYGVGDVARWYNPLFGTEMRIEHRTHASEQAVAVARNLLEPDARTPFAQVPYFWSDQYDVRIQAYGNLREHDDAVILFGDLEARRLLVAYRSEDRLTGVLAVGQSPLPRPRHQGMDRVRVHSRRRHRGRPHRSARPSGHRRIELRGAPARGLRRHRDRARRAHARNRGHLADDRDRRVGDAGPPCLSRQRPGPRLRALPRDLRTEDGLWRIASLKLTRVHMDPIGQQQTFGM